MGAYSYQKLEVWSKSIDLVVAVYELTKMLPKYEMYALSDQLRRAAVSVPSNIAEGQKRFTRKDTVHFCSMALGSLAELETQLIIVERVHKIDTSNYLESCEIITRMLHAMIKSLRALDV